MSSHSVLNQDVLFSICEFLDLEDLVDWEKDVKQETLARCARVCKAFYLPAIRVLWRRLYDLFPLLSLLPSFKKIEPNHGVEIYVSGRRACTFICISLSDD